MGRSIGGGSMVGDGCGQHDTAAAALLRLALGANQAERGTHLLRRAHECQASGQGQRLLGARDGHVHPPVVKPAHARRQYGRSGGMAPAAAKGTFASRLAACEGQRLLAAASHSSVPDRPTALIPADATSCKCRTMTAATCLPLPRHAHRRDPRTPQHPQPQQRSAQRRRTARRRHAHEASPEVKGADGRHPVH